MTAPLYSGEAKVLSWGENNTSGRFVRLEIEGGGEHPFRGYEGERFMVVFVPIGNDEKPMAKLVARKGKAKRVAPLSAEPGETADAVASPISMGDAPTREDGAPASNRLPPSGYSSPAKPKKRWHEMRPSARAAMMAEDHDVWAFLNAGMVDGGFVISDPEAADEEIKCRLGIISKAELDTPGTAARRFEVLEGNFHAWRQAKQHGAA